MAVKLLETLCMLVAAGLIIAGTATLWNARKAMVDAGVLQDNDEIKSRYNWDLIIFWLVWIAAGAALYFPRARVFTVLATGMVLILSLQRGAPGIPVTNYASWGSINSCRILQGDSATAADWNRKCASGGIVAYVGVLLALIIAFFSQGNMLQPEKTFGGKDKILSLVSVLFTVIGVIVLWSSEGAAVPTSSGFDLYGKTIDTTIETLLATFYVVGATYNGNAVLRAAAGFVTSLVFVLIFHDMFVVAATVASPANRQTYAGFLFCWFSMIVNLIVVTLQHWQNV